VPTRHIAPLQSCTAELWRTKADVTAMHGADATENGFEPYDGVRCAVSFQVGAHAAQCSRANLPAHDCVSNSEVEASGDQVPKEFLVPRTAKQVKKIFDKYDLDGSLVLESSEIKKLLKEMGQPHEDEDVKMVVTEMDHSSDQSLGPAAFLAWWKQQAPVQQAHFDAADTKGNGVLDRDEVEEMLRQCNQPHQPADVEAMMCRCRKLVPDAPDAGPETLSREQFKTWQLSGEQFKTWHARDEEKWKTILEELDGNSSGQIEEGEARRLFDRYRTDKQRKDDTDDGYLLRAQVVELLRNIGYLSDQPDPKEDDPKVDGMMKAAHDANIGISQKDFIRWWGKHPVSSGLCTVSNSCQTAWLSIDSEGKGSLQVYADTCKKHHLEKEDPPSKWWGRFVTVSVLTVLFTWVFVGHWVFWLCERDRVEQQRKDYTSGLIAFQAKHNISSHDLQELLSMVGAEELDTYTDLSNAELTNPYSYRFPDIYTAFSTFAITTTVGYGRIAPETTAGRWWLMFSVTFGIPCMGGLLAVMAKRLLNAMDKMTRLGCFDLGALGADPAHVQFVQADKNNSKTLSKEEATLASESLLGGELGINGNRLRTWCDKDMLNDVFSNDGKASDGDPKFDLEDFKHIVKELNLPHATNGRERKRVISAFVTLCLWLSMGTVVYTLLEDWTFGDALYFCIVTLSTVGLGDMAPLSVAGVCFTFVFDLIGLEIFVINLGTAAAWWQEWRVNQGKRLRRSKALKRLMTQSEAEVGGDKWAELLRTAHWSVKWSVKSAEDTGRFCISCVTRRCKNRPKTHPEDRVTMQKYNDDNSGQPQPPPSVPAKPTPVSEPELEPEREPEPELEPEHQPQQQQQPQLQPEQQPEPQPQPEPEESELEPQQAPGQSQHTDRAWLRGTTNERPVDEPERMQTGSRASMRAP
jgi:Ca2+-binding EF-hand superfamily protein